MVNAPENYQWNMQLALEEAEAAFRADEVPVGAVVVDEEGNVLARAHNIKEKSFNPCGHAEILAIQKAAKEIQNWRLVKATLFVTLEPCVMCMGAIVNARLKGLVFGAYDKKGGALSLGYNLHQNSKLNHRFKVVGGVEHYKCSKVISDFFRITRSRYNVSNRFKLS